MAWRSVIISKPAYLSYKQKSMQITQGEEKFLIPLEDIAVLVIDNQQVTISASLLSACADNRLAVITVNKSHTPNGIFHPYLCHSRALKIMRQQLVMTKPHKKKLWQIIIKQKLLNQALVLDKLNISKTADKLVAYANMVRSGDPDNLEATAAQIYFPAIFGKGFTRADENVFNAALNYGYSILRGAIAPRKML